MKLLLPLLLVGFMTATLTMAYFINKNISQLRSDVQKIQLRQSPLETQKAEQPKTESDKSTASPTSSAGKAKKQRK